MSPDINIKFNIDQATAQSQIQGLKQQVATQENKMQQVWNNVKTNYTYYTQLSSIVLSNIARAAKGSAELARIQGFQAAQTAIVGEIAVFQTAKQASAALISGNIFGAISLGAISVMLQASVVAALTAQIESMQLGKEAEEIRRQMDAYNV